MILSILVSKHQKDLFLKINLSSVKILLQNQLMALFASLKPFGGGIIFYTHLKYATARDPLLYCEP